MQVFVETHYYDGGFKSLLFPLVRRPDILPSIDGVGLKSSEAELTRGDCALELSIFRQGQHTVTWLGCYTRGTDFKYGDRGTYIGVGVWLIDATLVHGVHLIGFLRDAALTLAKGGMRSPETLVKLHTFVKEFPDLGWCAPYALAPLPYRPAAAQLTGVGRSSYLILPDNQDATFDLAAIDVLDRLRTQLNAAMHSRCIYFLAHHSKIFVRETERLAFKNALTYAEHLLYTQTASEALRKQDGSYRYQAETVAI